MPYTALPDRRMPYDNDGTVVGYRQDNPSNDFTQGMASYLSGAGLIEVNDDDFAVGGVRGHPDWTYPMLWFFFPEQREVTAFFSGWVYDNGAPGSTSSQAQTWQGSNNSTNGVDGSWETASLPSGSAAGIASKNLDNWRSQIAPISFTGAKQVLRGSCRCVVTSYQYWYWVMCHLYGEKAAGQTPDDIIYINHDDTPGVEYTAPEDFGDQPLGTTVVRQFRVKNTSATKTANGINIQCNDSDFAISTDGSTWVVTINITSLSAGAESATMYVRCTTPAPGATLGPRFNRIVTTVASYT